MADLTIERARVAVVGTRDWTDAQRPFAERRTREYVRSLPAGTLVVSGGARGVDKWAADEALKAGLELEEHLPEWERYERRAGAVRNAVVADRCHMMVAIWDGQSRGTKNAIDLAHGMMKPVTIIRI